MELAGYAKRLNVAGQAAVPGWVRSRAMRAALGGLALGVVGLVLWRGAVFQRDRTTTLAGGLTLRLLKVTAGTNHLGPGSFWATWVARFAPGLVARFDLRPPPRFPTPEDEIGLWFELRGPNAVTMANRLQTGLRLGLVDHTGFEVVLPPQTGFFLHAGIDPSNRLVGLGTAVFPRHSRQMRLRLFQQIESPGAKLLEVGLDQPLVGARRAWTSNALPAVQVATGVGFTLEALQVVPAAGVENAGRPLRNSHSLRARFRVQEGNTNSLDWQVERLVMSDARGNRIDVTGHTTRRTGERLEVEFPCWLWPAEPSWELAVEFVRARAASVPPGERWTLRGIAVPPRTSLTPIAQTNTLAGVRFSVLALVGDQATYPGRERDVHELHTLELDLPPPLSKWRFHILDARDDRGREVPVTPVSQHARGDWSYGLRFEGDVRTADVTLALQPVRWLRFAVSAPAPGFR